MSLTDISRFFLGKRLKDFELYASQPEAVQQKVLRRLLNDAAHTTWGREHGYASIKSYTDYAAAVPLQTYDDLKPYIDRMRNGEDNLLWHSKVKWYAQSSGTTNDKSKYIPVTCEGLDDTHYRGGADCVAIYLGMNPSSRFFSGKGLILGGSFNEQPNPDGSRVGDLSAVLMQNINPVVNFFRVPSKEVALMREWESKIERLARDTASVNVTNLSGVPSWMLVVLKRVLDITGKRGIEEVWPNLEVFFHGGVSFTPYRSQYKELIKSDQMHYVETYNASEGFFGIQSDLSDPSMMLMIDYGVFYEFVPMTEFGKPNARAVSLTDVELGKNYAMVISSSCGLWRYVIGDTVMFTSKSPYKFRITGRTKHFINAFGEELIVDNAEKGLARACAETGAKVLDYSAAPVYMDAQGKCRHQWLIEFAVMPDSLDHFVTVLDAALKSVNSDYEAKRTKDIALQLPEVVVARPGLFNDWLKGKGKLGGQHKVPRLSNTRDIIDEMLALNSRG
ncbi:MAG TPA: GH3 auxin-responsive promoter family protein [Candidatus Avibacteroides faecavium]|mgnify:CR=1 FL=1|nr:GH3 auxin-responsive promoter family protein [Candidatus Avibacteroides faecavium]